MTDPSSITSVTEEDSDESDTTETSYNSKTIDSVSSVLYSSECNTDDKLSTSLTNVSISKSNNASPSSKKRLRKYEEPDDDDSATTTDQPYPYGCNPLPLDRNKHKHVQVKKKQKNFHSTALTRYVLQKRLIHKAKAQSSSLPKQEEENFGVDDPNNYLYTDFSDTSSIPVLSNNEDNDLDSENEGDSQSGGNNSKTDRPFLPNMSSGSWFQARCFDQYWSHYDFVMGWYRQHVQAVNMLSTQLACPYATNARTWPQPKSKKKAKAKRAKNRARNRRLSRAKKRAAREEALNESVTTQDSDSNGEESELEMEITEDMMDFFSKSYKHRMERDQIKKESDEDTKGESNKDGANNFSIRSGPKEQPGIRRAAEMKTLYGQGAPMIHGMETALQMTYDKVLDRHKPKLWPNMPLKIIFAK